MSILVFENPGHIDPVSMMIFGVSAKENESAIGMFGTGLKYAIAVLLRNGFQVVVYSGNESYVFNTAKHEVRNKSFDVVQMNNSTVNFTTELGKFWEPWMAVRELASNALDEHGSWRVASSYQHDTNGTTIIVSGPGVDKLYTDCAGVFLGTRPVFECEHAAVHSGMSHWIYYRGIRALKLDRPSLYTYNILENIQLTEDRTIKYMWDVTSSVTKTVNRMSDKSMMMRVVGASTEVMEGTMHYNIIPSELLTEVVGELVSSFGRVPNSLKEACDKSILKVLTEKEECVLDNIDLKRLNKAIDFCKQINFNVDEYPIIVTNHLGADVLGRAANNKIYLSKRVFSMGTKMVAGTLIEEYLHIAEGVDDCTRQMQNLLFDTICSLGERITGETL